MDKRRRAILIAIPLLFLAGVTLIIISLPGEDEAPAAATPTPVEAAAGASPTPRVPPTATPVQYVVQPGDTLLAIAQTHDVTVEELIAANEIANPDVLQVGQTLVIPVGGLPTPDPSITPSVSPSPTAPPPPTPIPTLTPSGPPAVEIAQVLATGDAATEAAFVQNLGGMASLKGWTLADGEGNTFIFPAVTLFEGAVVRVHSRAGDNAPHDLYWGRAAPAWQSGEMVTLRDAAENVVDTYIVP
jgi:LysM repeat protein